MVAYSFKKQFVAPILLGTKCQTIRANGKRRHARPGDALQLYTGMRTKQCRKIGDAMCRSYELISINVELWAISTGVFPKFTAWPEWLDDFARRDGFADRFEMRDFWLKAHGPGLFQGVLIRWQEFRPAI